MAYTRGRCTNFDYCLVADSRRDVDVLVGQEFVCPQCGKPLRAPPVRNDATGWAVAAMIGLGALTLISGALYLGIRLGERARLAAPPPIAAATPMKPAAAPKQAPPPAAAADPVVAPAARPEAVLLRIAGSPQMAERLVPALAAEFLSQNGDADVASVPDPRGEVRITGKRAGYREAIVVTASSATEGFRALAGGGADMVMAVRPMLPGEHDALSAVGVTTPASEHVVALDALAVVVNQANPLASLRMDQVRGVFTGAVKSWSAVGGAGGAIHLYIEQNSSELRAKFAAIALGDGDVALSAALEADAAQVASAVAADPRGIGVVDAASAARVRALAIAPPGAAPVAPSNRLAVALGDYPLAYRLYFYNPATAGDPIVQRFVAFAMSPDGQALLAPIGLVSPFLMPPAAPLPAAAPEDVRKFVGAGRRLEVAFHFAPDGRRLDEAGARDIDRLAFLLQANHVSGDRLAVAGFSDNRQRPAVALAAARARADALAMVLARYGLAPARVNGFGMEFPAADNNTDEGRGLNRRSEIYLMP